MICNWCHYIYSIFILAFYLKITTTESNATLPELPDEYDDFRAIRVKNKLYVDKSHYINLLLESEEKFFSMCRPGRFGKSNFLQMLHSFFKGQKEQFEGLNIFETHDWKSSPVIYLDFSIMDVSTLENFEACLNHAIILEGRSYGIELDENLPLYPDELHNNASKLGQLIDHMSEDGRRNQSIVVLIDEYDWPIRQYRPGYVHNEENHACRLQIRSFLSPFFHQFELVKQRIKLLFFTCTAKISYANPIDRGRNSITLKDLTFEPQFSGMIGLTGEELESNLKPHIGVMVASQPNETFRTLVRELRRRYNGYCFTREYASECRLYNFRSVISCLRDKKFDNLWHPVKDSKYNLFEDYQDEIYRMKRNIFNMSGLTVSQERLQKHYTLADIPIDVGLIFCGYLTFRGYNEQTREFSLDFPNDEIRESYRRAIYKYILGKEISSEEFRQKCETISDGMIAGGIVNFVEQLNSLAFKPADGIKLPDHDLYSYERIARIFEGCNYSLHENNILSENEGFNVTISSQPDDWLGRRAYKYGMRIEVTNHSEYRINFEFGRSAACAINVLLKAVGAEGELRQSAHGHVAYLLGINFGTSGDAVEDWIGITYFEGKCKNVHASHLHYEEMYAYLLNQTAYSRLV